MVTRNLHCPRCDSTDVIRHGKDRKGVQRYRCHACAYTFRENPKPKGYTDEEKQRILAAYRERMSLRGADARLRRLALDRLHVVTGRSRGASPP